MGKSTTLAIKIVGDASSGIKAMDDVEGRTSSFGSSLGKMAGVVGGVFAVDKVLDFGKASFDAASNLEQMAGSVDAIFGQSASQIDALAAKAHNAVGLSTADYDQMAAVIGSQLKNAGVPMDQLVGKTSDLIQKGADMSAVFGGSAADAVDALSSVMKGEFDPIEKYGVSINQTAINAELAARHQDKLTGAALRQAQVTAALDLVTKQTASTQGQFAAQGQTAAEKSQQLSAWFTDLQAKVGAGLLPIFTGLASFFQYQLAPAFDAIFAKGGPLTGFFEGARMFVGQFLAAVIDLYQYLAPKLLPIFDDVARVISTVVVPAFKQIWDFIQNYAVPIFKSVLGPIISAVQENWHKLSAALEDNRGTFENLYNKIKPFLEFLKNDVAPFVGVVLGKAFSTLGSFIKPVVDTIAWILDKAGAVIGFIGKVGSFVFGSGSGGSSAGGGGNRGAGDLFGASPSTAGGIRTASPVLAGVSVGPGGAGQDLGGGNVYITVQGALDPLGVAEQIAQLLDQRARRLGLSVAAVGGRLV